MQYPVCAKKHIGQFQYVDDMRMTTPGPGPNTPRLISVPFPVCYMPREIPPQPGTHSPENSTRHIPGLPAAAARMARETPRMMSRSLRGIVGFPCERTRDRRKGKAAGGVAAVHAPAAAQANPEQLRML